MCTYQTIEQVKKYVILLRFKAKFNIEGLGSIDISTADNQIKLINVLYVLTLECQLFRINQHIQLAGCTQYLENNLFMLAFHKFLSDATLSD